jgi:hypothetical protein
MLDKIKEISPLEWLLFEVILFTILWINSPYLGNLLTYILCPIFLGVLIISLIADKLDTSKIGSSYYLSLLYLIIGPILVYVLFNYLGLGFDWSKN